MNKKIMNISFVVGFLLIILALIYWLIPGKSLPTFIPGYGRDLTVTHPKRAIASLILGLGALAFGWYQRRKKTA